MSAGLLSGGLSFPGLGSGIAASSACSGVEAARTGDRIVDFGGGIGFPKFLRDASRRSPTGTLIAIVVLVLGTLWLLFGGSSRPRRRRRTRRRR